ncbi:MAG: alpha-glucan family phosphorylase [Planctomycetota bacterium]|nr:MAG: alpha-glucan family phosphorylase [Planctomycetota bacterium]
MKLDPLKKQLLELSSDLWWTWSPEAQALFQRLEPHLWRSSRHNPKQVLLHMEPDRWQRLRQEANFERQVQKVLGAWHRYYREGTWFSSKVKGEAANTKIAYFCSEYALHESMPQYAGGLGVLAGDHLKSASDLGIPLVAIGLLYAHGYYRQELSPDGATQVVYPNIAKEDWPLIDTGNHISCPIGKRKVKAKIWKLQVGRVPLYLLDTDLEQNRSKDRRLTQGLYKGEPEERLRQQVLLGVGGVLALHAVKEKPTVFHLNEGHAAFCNLERLRREVEKGRSWSRALQAIRASSVFTTHTPVAAGHDRYEAKAVRKWLGPTAKKLPLSAGNFAALGRERPQDSEESFCMTVLALKTAARVNGVAALHGDTSRKMWQGLYSVEEPEQVPIGHVTNGIHIPTWLVAEARPFYRKHLRPRWSGRQASKDWWAAADQIPLPELWQLRRTLKSKLIHFLRDRLVDQAVAKGADPQQTAALYSSLDPDALTLGFARRFATYKRAPLLFHNQRRLAALLRNPEQPVQIVFAGKAHPRDQDGQAYAQRIYRMTQKPAFRGRVFLLEDYDMEIGRMLTSGCDLWLNTPLRPHEASGTSGMKPTLYGGLNCSILDGWWPEGFDGKNGWAIEGGEFENRRRQDRADAEALYALLEQEIVPLYYRRGRDRLPRAWLSRCRHALQSLPAAFSSHRMLQDYWSGYYAPAHLGEECTRSEVSSSRSQDED